ncbi:uncharacterized protein LOC128230314 [Mya arenaria]|uniref:uncharacterized protein LOC128230314 n=1 Tax=Mya arenaria TaxID=6604 RepID=UPI0022E7471F|nr:uncharacterized protein LOC128230314 [Mya arenaria]
MHVYTAIVFQCILIWSLSRGTYVFISSETCGSSFYIDPDESLDVVYEGGSVSTDDEDGCYVQLNNKHSPQKTICFDEVSMDIDSCLTTVLVIPSPVSTDPVKSWSCLDMAGSGWCGERGTADLFVKVTTTQTYPRAYVDLRVYLRTSPNDTSDTLTPDKSESGSNHAPTIWIVGVIVALMLLVVGCGIFQTVKRRRELPTQVTITYPSQSQTAAGPRNPQCAQPSAVQYSGNTNYNLVPNAYPQTVHVNSYTPHMPPGIPHMQSASPHMSRDSPHTPLVSPSAPPIDLYARTMQPQHFDESAPPSYEQCMKNAKMS